MSTVCATSGGTAKPDFLHKLEWVGVEALPAAVFGPIDDVVGVLLSSVAPKLFDVDQLCAQNLTVPLAFTDADLSAKINDFVHQGGFTSLAFYLKLWEWIQYGAWLNFCDCPGGGTVPSFTPSPGTDNYTQGTCGNTTIGIRSDFHSAECLAGCTFYIQITDLAVHGDGTGSPPVLYIGDSANVNTGTCNAPTTGVSSGIPFTGPDGSGNWHATPGQYGPYPGSAVCTPGLSGFFTSVVIVVSFPTQTAFNPNQLSVHAQVIPVCSPPAPDPGPPPDITAPPAPARDCSAGTLCNIDWTLTSILHNNATVSDQTNNTTNNISAGITTISAGPVIYVHGSSHAVTGRGEVSVSEALGCIVTASGFAPGAGSIVTDPQFNLDGGFITFGNGDGWGVTSRVNHSPQVMQSDVQQTTKIGFDCGMATGFNITELIAPPPP
jgi:hypothetical protein